MELQVKWVSPVGSSLLRDQMVALVAAPLWIILVKESVVPWPLAPVVVPLELTWPMGRQMNCLAPVFPVTQT